jgi:Xaa-Pro dipeptidase
VPALARTRTRKIFQRIEADGKDVDAVILRNGVEPHVDLSFFYVTGIPSGIFEGSSAILKPGGESHVVTSRLEEESARKAATGFKLHIPRKRGEEAATTRRLAGTGKMKIGINAPELTYQDYRLIKKMLPKAKVVDVSQSIARARMIKDEAEVEAIAEAARISSQAAKALPELLKTGAKESEVAAELDYLQQKLGGAGPSFTTIAAFGPNAAEPHYTALTSRLKKGQFALFDYGTRVRRYCSDITRTFFHGTPKAKDRRMYETVQQAQEAAFELVGPGAKASDIHHAADDVINATEFKGTFIHGLGHGLGLAVHDGGSLSGMSKLVLEPGMVLTVEPGVYLPGYGGVRIEDDVLITKTGHRKLTNATRELITT